MNDARHAASPEGAPDPLIGRVLDGRFRILSQIARGGMGAIYRAEQEPLRRTVALKVLSPQGDPSALEGFRARFFREASICSRLTHPNTVRIYDYGKTNDGIYYIAMELLQGQTLKKAMETDAPMAPWRVINLLKQVCASLAEAHGQGLIHRDLKPSNILLTEHADGTEFVNVVDFGLVKDLGTGDADTTQLGMIVGSPMYMSPEQILQSDLTERSDIYSLGVILYGLLTGKKPFKQESALALMNCHLRVQPPPFSQVNPAHEVPAGLEWVTMTCMAKDPGSRFASVRELSRALTACDMELRGMVFNLQLRLENGRVILPPEVEEHLGRRGAVPARSSDSGVRSGVGSGSVPSGTLAPPPPERPAWLLPLALVALVGLGLMGSFAAWLLVRYGGADPAPEATEAPAALAPPEEAPVDRAPVEPSALPAEPAPPRTPEPPVAMPRESAPRPAAAPKESPPRPTASPKPVEAAPTSPPVTQEPAPKVVEPAPVEPKPAPKEQDDWAKPSSDLKNPWGD